MQILNFCTTLRFIVCNKQCPTTDLAHIKLKYGLFSRVISCHDKSAQNCQKSWSNCAPRTRTQALRRRRVSGSSLYRDVHAPGKRRCRACSMRQGRRPVKTGKNLVLGQSAHVCHCLVVASTYPDLLKLVEIWWTSVRNKMHSFFLRHGVLVELSVVFILLPFGE